jgi:hypothetical protein
MKRQLVSAILCWLAITFGWIGGSDASSVPADRATGQQADASFIDGKWAGQGIFQLGPKVYNCPTSWQIFAGDARTYEVRDAYVECDQGFRNTFTVISTFELKPNGDLYFTDRATGEARKTGEIRGNVLRTSYEQNGMTNSIEIIMSGPFMVYRDVMGVPGQQPSFSFVGIFQRATDPVVQSQQAPRP